MKATKEEYQDYHDRLFGDVEGAKPVDVGGGAEFTSPSAKELYNQAVDTENNARLSDVSRNLVATADKLLADTKSTIIADGEYLETVKSGIEMAKQSAEALKNWIKNERRDGATVDAAKLPVIENAKSLTPEQAVEIVDKLANELQQMLPSDHEAYINPDITEWENDDGSKVTAEDIIGKNRDSEQTIHVSRAVRKEYSGTAKQQKQHAEEAEANIVSLSPGENLERLIHIAKEIWDTDENKDKTDDEKKQAVFEAIKKADYGYARNYQQKPVDGDVLSSAVGDNGLVLVGRSYIHYNGVGAAKERVA